MYHLTRSDLTEESVLEQLAWSVELTVTSSDPELYPVEVFVFQVEDPESEVTRAWFTCIASPAQLEEYPVAAADPPGEDDLQQPYFRLASLKLVSRNPDLIEQMVAEVSEEITLLRLNLEAMQHLTEGETVDL